MKYKNFSKFYQVLLFSVNISFNPGPVPNSVSQGLHFLHVNVNSILPKLNELKTILGNTKTPIIGITESKIDNSISDIEVKAPRTAFFDVIGTEIREELHVMVGRIYERY